MAKRFRHSPDSIALAVRAKSNPGLMVESSGEDHDPDAAILQEARERWNRCDEHEASQRESTLGAKKFRAGDQWPAAIKIQRQGSTAIQGQAAQPPRPCLTIDRLSQPVRQVSNAIKTANFAIDVLPNGHGADDATAEIITGILRRVQNQARGESPIEWAADQAAEGGFGWFRLRTEHVYESAEGVDPAALFDQELRMERITNNLTVYDDPSAMRPTRSDALFKFVTEDVSKDEFRRLWPNADVQGIEDFCSTGDMKGWVSDDSVRIAEYWRVVYGSDTIYVQYEDGRIASVATLPKDLKAAGIVQSRSVRPPKVEGFKISATQVLERWDWTGSRIPLIPILGEELNVDGKVVLRGVIQEGMDAQRMVNYTYSGAMETFALASKSPILAATGAVDNYKAIWQTANVFNYSWLPWDAYDGQGRPMPPPVRDSAEPPIQAAVALMRISEEAIQATTGIWSEGLGESDPQHKSGRAIQSLQAKAELGTSNYPDNVKRALIYAGELMVEILPKITRPGQILQIIGVDDVPQQVMVGVPFSQQDGKAQPVDPKHPALAQLLEQGEAQFYDLRKGKYAVTVDVGKASATRREEGAAALGELIPHLPPELAAVATPDYVEQLSFPGAHAIAEKLRKALPPQLRGDDGAENAQTQQLQQQVQALQQQLQSKVAEKQAEVQAKGQIDLQKTQLQEQAESQRSQQDNQVQIQKAEIAATATMSAAQAKVDAENFRSYVDAMESRLAKSLDLHLQHVTALMQRTHEARTQAVDHAHEVGMAALEHQQALEQGQQAAALAPTPTEGGNTNAG